VLIALTRDRNSFPTATGALEAISPAYMSILEALYSILLEILLLESGLGFGRYGTAEQQEV
jgi:hypothetical protein